MTYTFDIIQLMNVDTHQINDYKITLPEDVEEDLKQYIHEHEQYLKVNNDVYDDAFIRDYDDWIASRLNPSMESFLRKNLRCLKYFLTSIKYHYLPFIAKPKDIDFIFIVHARYEWDYANVLPFLNWMRILPNKLYVWLMQLLPPAIVDEIQTESGLTGLMISSSKMHEFLSARRKNVKREIKRIHRLISNLCEKSDKKTILGLGAWWPGFTKKGTLVAKVFDERYFKVTTGHTMTVLSIVRKVRKLLNQSRISKKRAHIAILGCGNIGTSVAQMLLEKYTYLTLIDINEKKLFKKQQLLQELNRKAIIKTEIFDPETICAVLSRCHIGVCATSSTKVIMGEQHIPDHFVFVDDSQPEAIPRFSENDSRFTLEGGLMFIRGMNRSCNIGTGLDDNILGCLSEAYVISLAQKENQILENTLGDVQQKLFKKYHRFCKIAGIDIGQYKSRTRMIDEEYLVHALHCRDVLIQSGEISS